MTETGYAHAGAARRQVSNMSDEGAGGPTDDAGANADRW
jgi:hypothetical protein